MNKIYKCFISSTFRDLEEERRRVIEAILDAHQLPAGMENFNASDKSQWDYIKMMLEDCDYFIVIVAHRYGSTDEGGMSYTEKETRYALDKGIPVLTFIISDSATWPHDGYEDDPENKVRLNQFKKFLTADKLVKSWSDKNDLAAKVTAALHEVIKTHPRPGYIRGDAQNSPIQTTETSRQPEFMIEFGEFGQTEFPGKPEIKINLSEICQVEQIPLLSHVEELSYCQPEKFHVSDNQVDEWNMLVETRNEEIEEYNAQAEEYNQRMEAVRTKFSISNVGTQRANNLGLILEFPEWITVFNTNDEIEKPQKPDIPENPVRAAMNRLQRKNDPFASLRAAAFPTIGVSMIKYSNENRINYPKLASLLKEKPSRYLKIESEHIAEYHADTLQHGSTLCCDVLSLLPDKREAKQGVVKIICHCDELPTPQIIEIPISTE